MISLSRFANISIIFRGGGSSLALGAQNQHFF
jgi:FAD/FMN-containing dehydrogenase